MAEKKPQMGPGEVPNSGLSGAGSAATAPSVTPHRRCARRKV